MRKFILFFLVILIVGYFGIGYYVYDSAASVPCEVYESEQNNTPSNFKIWEEYEDTINASEYFIDDYEDVTFPSTDLTGPVGIFFIQSLIILMISLISSILQR